MSMLEMTQRRERGHTVVALEGEVDLDSVDRLRERLDGIVAIDGPCLIVDLTGVRFIDTTGLGMFVRFLDGVRRRGGSLALVAPRGQPLRVFSRTNLARLFPIYDSVSDAVAGAG
ncbi:anti-sigma B factor antagonist [Nonomuraea soli]|uniref:Anti-sigma factor antagonist n=2 Tax=Nonomuraea soli TaxID=1032476 RepID=A0A7W0CEN0_9ACTN|nr:STAS domain-containing protein [Nonomuraea soli]MBA2889768.1 anti-sigma B factor antagonist [Nonomuraea soli]